METSSEDIKQRLLPNKMKKKSVKHYHETKLLFKTRLVVYISMYTLVPLRAQF